MKLTFLGAAHEVTGSRYLLEACGKNLMIDYGMEQGRDIYENAPLPVPAASLDAVLVTHAHIDHTGYLPLLYKQGFRGPIYATAPTSDLCGIMLLDSAHIQESETEWKNRKAQRSGKPLVEPIYTSEDAGNTIALFRPCPYKVPTDICEGISARFIDVGHLLGSASIELTITEDGKTQTVVFSGDVGNLHQPLLRDPQYLTKADYVIIESTYGDRSHGPVPDYIASLTTILQETLDRGGNVIIPSFAVGRTQELLYFIRKIKQDGLVKGHPNFPVVVDSPLANEATHVFTENTRECADEETLALLDAGINPIWFPGLQTSITADDSKAINVDETPKVILSASGMCDAGRIRHHLKYNLWRPECTVLFVGYQSEGTVGRQLIDGADEVKLFGDTVHVAAHIEKLAGISGHADNNGLMRWMSSFKGDLRHVFVTHGEDGVTETFAARIRDELKRDATAPYNGECWDLTACEKLADGNRNRIEKAVAWERPKKGDATTQPTQPAPKKAQPDESTVRDDSAYGQLLKAGEQISQLLTHMRSRSRKEMDKLTKALYAILNRYNRR